jgi:hypothetical protein
MLRVAPIRPQRLDRREFHDQHQVPAARVANLVAADLETLNLADRPRKDAHALAERGRAARGCPCTEYCGHL